MSLESPLHPNITPDSWTDIFCLTWKPALWGDSSPWWNREYEGLGIASSQYFLCTRKSGLLPCFLHLLGGTLCLLGISFHSSHNRLPLPVSPFLSASLFLCQIWNPEIIFDSLHSLYPKKILYLLSSLPFSLSWLSDFHCMYYYCHPCINNLHPFLSLIDLLTCLSL